MKISRLEIEDLYGKHNIKLAFDDKLTILVGINGAYKTTILNVISDMLRLNADGNRYYLKHALMNLTDDCLVNYWQVNGMSLPQFRSFVNENKDLFSYKNQLLSVFNERIDKDMPINGFYALLAKQEGKDLEDDIFRQKVNLDFISNYDVKAETPSDKSLLDVQLNKLLSDYGFYLTDRNKEVHNRIALGESVNKEVFNEIYKYNNIFRELVNRSFSETHKKLDDEESRLQFIHEDGSKIDTWHLSAGEKQLLIILLTVLLERSKEYILLMDEPEISLHVDWQYELLNNIFELNPHVQVIMTTHSPMMFGSGWGDKVSYMEDLIVQ